MEGLDFELGSLGQLGHLECAAEPERVVFGIPVGIVACAIVCTIVIAIRTDWECDFIPCRIVEVGSIPARLNLYIVLRTIHVAILCRVGIGLTIGQQNGGGNSLSTHFTLTVLIAVLACCRDNLGLHGLCQGTYVDLLAVDSTSSLGHCRLSPFMLLGVDPYFTDLNAGNSFSHVELEVLVLLRAVHSVNHFFAVQERQLVVVLHLANHFPVLVIGRTFEHP